MGEFQAGAAPDVEDLQRLLCFRKLRGDRAVQAVIVARELRIPKVGDGVEEVRQTLDVVADAAGVASDATGFAQALELFIEHATIVFDRHTFSVTARRARLQMRCWENAARGSDRTGSTAGLSAPVSKKGARCHRSSPAGQWIRAT